MSLSILRCVALVPCVALAAVVSLAPATASAQRCGNSGNVGNPGWGGNPGWNPAPTQYFLGVQVQTVPVSQGGFPGGGPISGPMALGGISTRIAPGYGQTVYGQRVVYVTPNSPAFHAGLEIGDILLDANGAPLDSSSDLRTAIARSRGYMQMKVQDVRSGRISWVVANLGGNSPNPGPINGPGPISGPMFSQTNPRSAGGSGGLATLMGQLRDQFAGSNGRQAPIMRRR